MTTMGEVMVTRGGSLNPGAFPDEKFELYSIPAHDTGEPVIISGSEIGSAKQIVQPGDVMVAKIVPHIRRARIVQPSQGRRQIASSEWIIFRGRSFEPEYLRHFLLSDRFHRQFMNTVAGVGGSLMRARPAQVKNIELPLPPLPEQRRIAAILDHADALRAKRRQVLQHLDCLSQSIFERMFLDEPSDEVTSARLGDVVSQIDNGVSPNCEARPASPDEWGVLKLGAVTYGRFQAHENKAYTGDAAILARHEVRRGDVLMTRKNTHELVGAVALVDEVRPRLALPDLIFRLSLDESKVQGRYFQALMMHPSQRAAVRSLASGSAASMPNISKARLRELSIKLPPVVRQQLFASRVGKVDAQRTAVQRALESEDELFASLQSRAFRGEL